MSIPSALNFAKFTPPEIQRTNLASVILQLLALNLGDVAEFPFLDPPKPDAIKDGYQTLFELGAVTEDRQLTELGRRLSKLPVDPRIGRIILAGHEENCLREILIIASILEIQDPRGVAPVMYAPSLTFAGPDGAALGESQRLTPQAGMFVVFPSWLSHGVRPYRGTRERISIAINFSLG